MTAESTRISVIEAILGGERELANSLLDTYAAANGSYRRAMNEVLEPVLVEIGIKWAEENTSLAQGYVAGKVAEDTLFKIIRDEQDILHTQEIKGTVVIGNIEDDFHSLGRKLVSIFLQSAGWIVHDLGSDVSPEEFVDKAAETDACIIGVSAMMYTTAANIKKVRDELDRRNLSGRIMLAVGGAVFRLRPELTREVGGDGTAANGYQVPQLFAELLARSQRETLQ
ncbi:MAG: cobalamin-dependent protein [Desulfuromonadaceae bacterium]|nr:cobalamin-dependent protein [Desulfuromonadaceae bacterium]MDD5105547.1 cobalamin-dependent protein [Desulfuromonadaceae bacterium]